MLLRPPVTNKQLHGTLEQEACSAAWSTGMRRLMSFVCTEHQLLVCETALLVSVKGGGIRYLLVFNAHLTGTVISR